MKPTTTQAPPQPIYRKDYTEPSHWIDTVELHFELGDGETLVHAKLTMRANPAREGAPLELMGELLDTRRVALDGRELGSEEYAVAEESLTLASTPASFVLETTVAIQPEKNLALSGLYRTSGNFCTQCEAEGFRRITWFLDRPDVMASYRVTIDGDPTDLPVMLSNGNRVSEETLDDGRRRVVWEDPHKKPSYLFALVAGKLKCHAGSFTTQSGREVALEIYVEPQNIDKCEHALDSLIKSMKWDEEVYGLEYDLDIYMIVAVGDFNMGAMENKGLNVFNSKFVLASPDTATDGDYEGIESVIAHEYFHNWTGNRVTCRDWFQLTLKEGLTVFRDQQFSADMLSADLMRIGGVRGLRLGQFPEDAGPMAHPIRPEQYIEMNNFYTATVYQKGAEVIRMYHTLLGAEGFRKGMDLYFERHDGSAVTCDDFRAAMADANGRDLAQFERWYTQAGTPTLKVSEAFDAGAKEYTLTFEQSRGEVPGQGEFEPMHLPVRMGLLSAKDGSDLPLHGEVPEAGATEVVLELTAAKTCVTFTGIDERPVPSLLRGFSAPVRLELEASKADLAFRMAHDSNAFNRWEAGQALMIQVLKGLIADAQAGRALELDPELADAYGKVLASPELDPAMRAAAMSIPAERVLGQEYEVVDPDAIHTARVFLCAALAKTYRRELQELYDGHAVSGPYRYDAEDMGKRSLRHASLGLIACLIGQDTGDGDEIALAKRHFDEAANMTEQVAGLAILSNHDIPERKDAMQSFYDQWKHDPLVIDKWFTVQSLASLPTVVESVVELYGHKDFTMKNPNRARSLVGAFAAGNQWGFHRADGAGYRFLADRVIEVDGLNPQVASRLVSAFNAWRRFDGDRQALVKGELERILKTEGLSNDVFEIVSKALS